MIIKIIIFGLIIWLFAISFMMYSCLIIAGKSDEEYERMIKLQKFKEAEDDLPYE